MPDKSLEGEAAQITGTALPAGLDTLLKSDGITPGALDRVIELRRWVKAILRDWGQKDGPI